MRIFRKTLSTILVASMITILFSGCVVISSNNYATGNSRTAIKGSGTVTTKEYDLPTFETVSLHSLVKLHYTAGDTTKVSIELDDNLIDYVDVEVRNNTLFVSDNDKTFVNQKQNQIPIQVFITAPSLSSVIVEGAIVTGTLEPLYTDSFALELNGAGDLRWELHAKELSVETNGAGNIVLSGSADNAGYSIAGAGNIEADSLVAKHVTAEIAGMGNITVHATETLEPQIAGMGSVQYKGNPTISNNSSGGLTSLTKMD